MPSLFTAPEVEAMKLRVAQARILEGRLFSKTGLQLLIRSCLVGSLNVEFKRCWPPSALAGSVAKSRSIRITSMLPPISLGSRDSPCHRVVEHRRRQSGPHGELQGDGQYSNWRDPAIHAAAFRGTTATGTSRRHYRRGQPRRRTWNYTRRGLPGARTLYRSKTKYPTLVLRLDLAFRQSGHSCAP
jgi:hypothetical protein